MTKKISTKALTIGALVGVSTLNLPSALALSLPGALTLGTVSALTALSTFSSQITTASARFGGGVSSRGGKIGKRDTSDALELEAQDQYYETLIQSQKKYNSTLQDQDNEAKDTSIFSRLSSWISPRTTKHLNNQQLSSDAVDYSQSHDIGAKHNNEDYDSGIESVRYLFQNLRSNDDPNFGIKSEDNDQQHRSKRSLNYKQSINKDLTQHEKAENKIGNHNFSSDVNNNSNNANSLELLRNYCQHELETPIKYDEYNFSAQIYSQSKLQYSRAQELNNVMKKAVEQWYKTYNTDSNPPECNLKMFVFDDSDTYSHFSQKNQIGNPDAGGYFAPFGSEKVILVYNSGFTHNAAHETAHGVEYCNSNDLTKLSEGRAQYIEMQQNPSLAAHTMSEVKQFIHNQTQYSLRKEISESCYSHASGKDPIIPYKVCAAVEEHLAEDKGINSFKVILEDPVSGPRKLANQVNREDLLKHVEHKSLEASMKEINALPVKCDQELYSYKQKTYDGEKKVTIYDTLVQAGNQKDPLPAQEVILFHNVIRVMLGDNRYYIDVDMSYKNTMLTLLDGHPVLEFCNEQGHKFSDTTMYKNEIRRIDNDPELTPKQKVNIKEHLTFIPAINSKAYPSGTIFEARLPTNDENSVGYKVSLFHNNSKVEELNSAQVYCASTNDGAKYVVFTDGVNNVYHAKGQDSAYLAVAGDKIFLLSGVPTTDEFSNQRHVHYHPDFLIPAKDIFDSDGTDGVLKEVTLKNAILMNDGDSQIAIDRTNNLADNTMVIRRGEKLDDRGSDSTHDDRHEAILTGQKGGYKKALHTTSYYLIGKSKDDGTFKNKALVIKKHAPTKVMQFPDEIDSIMKYNSTAFIPSTHDGRTNVTGMPKAPANDMIISSDDILTFNHPEHRPHAVEETGIADLSNYKDGTILDIKSKEHCIPGLSCSAPVIISDHKTGEEIGVLRGSHQLYVGSTFQNINPNAARAHQVHQQVNSAQVVQLSENTFEQQHSKTALTNSNPGKIILNGRGFSKHHYDNTIPRNDATDVRPNDLNISDRVKRSISEDQEDSLSNGQEHFDFEYNDNQSNLAGDLHDSDVWHDAVS